MILMKVEIQGAGAFSRLLVEVGFKIWLFIKNRQGIAGEEGIKVKLSATPLI
jgi:hypothetical protein